MLLLEDDGEVRRGEVSPVRAEDVISPTVAQPKGLRAGLLKLLILRGESGEVRASRGEGAPVAPASVSAPPPPVCRVHPEKSCIGESL